MAPQRGRRIGSRTRSSRSGGAASRRRGGRPMVIDQIVRIQSTILPTWAAVIFAGHC
ncbi:unnamed protein product [Spirodela intermedia]|uniref:Uncharacterized protein n=1 Tax=Spirodela intermedia TaxID=51605 RepID=A0A7I8L6D6_SPIIN|nr:unnamed protein product [Spirodela intermedia]